MIIVIAAGNVGSGGINGGVIGVIIIVVVK